MYKKYLYLVALSHFAVDVNNGSLAAILPFFVTYYGMDYTSIAGLMFASSFLSSIIQPIFGWLADKTSFKWFMPLGVLMAGLSLSATGFLKDYWSIFAAVTIMGAGAAIFHPEAARLVNAISGKERGAGMSIFSVGGNAGFGLGPLIAVFLITTFGMKGLGFYGGFCLLTGGALIILAPKMRAIAQEIKAQEKQENVKDVDEAAENDWPSFVKLTATIAFRSTVYTSISSFLPMFCIKILGASHAVGSATLSIIALLGVIATLVGGKLSDKIGYVKTIRYGSALLVLTTALLVFTKNIYVVFLMLLPLAFAMQGTYAAFVVLGQSYLAKSIGFASGITLGLSFSIGGIMVPGLGRFADTYGLESAMILVVVIASLCALSTLFLPEPKNSK